MKCDFHSHFLPGIDDEAHHSADSMAILEHLYSKGIETVCAKPHYVPHHESVEKFLERRERSYRHLMSYIETLPKTRRTGLPRIVLGAEVRVEKDFSLSGSLGKLEIGNTGHILLELPFSA